MRPRVNGLVHVPFDQSQVLQSGYESPAGQAVNVPEFNARADRLDRLFLRIEDNGVDILLPPGELSAHGDSPGDVSGIV